MRIRKHSKIAAAVAAFLIYYIAMSYHTMEIRKQMIETVIITVPLVLVIANRLPQRLVYAAMFVISFYIIGLFKRGRIIPVQAPHQQIHAIMTFPEGTHRYRKAFSSFDISIELLSQPRFKKETPIPCEGNLYRDWGSWMYLQQYLINLETYANGTGYLLILEDDAQSTVRDIKTELDYAIYSNPDADIICLDTRGVNFGGIKTCGGSVGNLFRIAAIPELVKTIRARQCTQVDPAIDIITSYLCFRSILKCGMHPVIEENGLSKVWYENVRLRNNAYYFLPDSHD
jgi:superoxide dismutase